MNGHNQRGRIIAPGQLNVTLQNVDGPLAEPATLQIPTAEGIKVVTFGGLTKLEALAGVIASHVKDPVSAVERAQAVLDECKKRQTAAAQVADAPPQSPQSPKI